MSVCVIICDFVLTYVSTCVCVFVSVCMYDYCTRVLWFTIASDLLDSVCLKLVLQLSHHFN